MELKGLDEVFPAAQTGTTVELKGLDEVFPTATEPTVELKGLDEVFPPQAVSAPEEKKDYYASPNTIITNGDLEALAKKYGAPASVLKSRVGLYGGITEGGELDPKEIAMDLFGRFSEGILASLPAKIDQLLQEPNVESALQELRTTIDDRKKGTLVGQAQDVSKFILGVRTGGALGNALVGSGLVGTIVQSAASGFGESKKGEEVEDALLYGAIGAAFHITLSGVSAGVAAYKGSQAAKKAVQAGEKIAEGEIPAVSKAADGLILEPKSYMATENVGANLDTKVKEILTANEDVNRGILHEIENLSYGAGTAQDLASSNNFGSLITFAKHMGADINSKDALKASEQAVEWYKKRATGGEGLRNLLDEAMSFKYQQAASKVLKDTVEAEMPEQASWIGTQFKKLMSADTVFRLADKKWGTDLATTQASVTGKLREITLHLGMKGEEYKPLYKAMGKANLKDEELYLALDKGINPTDPAKLEVVEGFRKFFQGAREEVNALGMDLKFRQNYVPHMPVADELLIPRIKDKAAELKIVEFTKESFAAKENADLVKALAILKGGAITSPSEANQLLNALERSPKILRKLRTSTFAAQARDGEIPDFIREKDVTKLAFKWLSATLKHTYLRDDLREIKKIKDSIGDKDIGLTTYLDDILQDVTGGIREDTVSAASRNFARSILESNTAKAEATTNPVKKAAYKLAANSPDILSYFMNKAYENYLGLNPKSLFTNLTQVAMSTVPEVGYRTGMPKLLGAYADMAKVFSAGKEIVVKDALLAKELGIELGDKFLTRNPQTILRNEGLLGKEAHKEVQDIMRGTLAHSAWTSGVQKVDEASTKLTMSMYAYTEVINRYATFKLGESLGDDLIEAVTKGTKTANSRDALSFFQNIKSSAHRRAITEAINAGKPDIAKKYIAEYLIGKSIYNYDKISAAQFARSAGPMMSMFTKFPTAILGDMAEVIAQHGAGKGSAELARKYGAPLILLAGVGHLLWPDGEERSGLPQLLMGKKTPLTGLAPASSIISILGEGYTPPPIELGMNAVKALSAMDEETSKKFMLSLAKGFVPGAVYYRAFTQLEDAQE